MKRFHLLLCFAILFFSSTLRAQDEGITPNWQVIDNPAYPTLDVGVATYNVVTDFGAVADGVTNDRNAFRSALEQLGKEGGGVLYAPAGKYLINGILSIPKGVTLRGDWKKPGNGQAVEGTILMVKYGSGSELENASFITMEPGTAILNLSFWYPDQDANNIKKYPPTILFGKSGYFGNEYCHVRNVTLVNSYNGIIFSSSNGGGCPNIHNVYGTVLSRGFEIDNVADIGRFDFIHFSPNFWAESGLPNAPAKGGTHEKFMKENATAIVMRRNDWSYTSFVDIEGYKVGFHALPSKSYNEQIKGYSTPNGHNYAINLKNCETGVLISGVASAGIMFTNVNAENCKKGFVIEPNVQPPKSLGMIQLYGCEIDAEEHAVYMKENADYTVALQECVVKRGLLEAVSNNFTASDCDFNGAKPQIKIGRGAKAILTGNRFEKGDSIKNNSLYKCAIDHTPVNLPKLPQFPDVSDRATKPAKNTLYVVTKSPYNAVPDAVTDNTTAIQQALNDAGTNGGGIVYLPPGKYKVLGNLTVPSGVELKGSMDLGAVPNGPGSVLEVYTGKGNPGAEPFLKLAANSGIRGVVFNYPEQMANLLPNVPVYPYCIQAQGENIYIVNVGTRATYYGIDLFTHKCDNHLVDYYAGHVFNIGIRVGGGSENGHIYNTQFNTLCYSNGTESKFGRWPNSPEDSDQALKSACYTYNYNHLEFMILGNCKNEVLYNDFNYGSHRALVFAAEADGASGIALGHGIDAARRAICYERLNADGFDLINSQIVVTTTSGSTPNTRYFETERTFSGKSTLFSSDYWGQPLQGIVMEGGELNLILPNFENPGDKEFFNLPVEDDNATRLNVHNAYLNRSNKAVVGEKYAIVQSSWLNLASSAKPENFELWRNNLWSAVFCDTCTIDRTGWEATASQNNTLANNAIDSNSSTRWRSSSVQISGEWFAVDMKEINKFNMIILDASAQPTEYPAGCAVYVSEDGENWGEPYWKVEKTTGSVTVLEIPTVETRYLKIEQTGKKSSNWSIYEFYLNYDSDLKIEPSSIKNPYSLNEIEVFYSQGILHLNGLNEGDAKVEIYNTSAQKVYSGVCADGKVNAGQFGTGIYLLRVEQGKDIYRAKIMLK